MFDDRVVRRCAGCGTRCVEGAAGVEALAGCPSCGLPASTTRDGGACADCRAGRFTPGNPDAALNRATEQEVHAYLSARWVRLVSSRVGDYLDQVARQIGRHVPGAPQDVRVLILDDPLQRMIALPSGTVMVSLGALQGLENEAELAFVLGHELAHVASGSTDRLLFRMGLGALSRGRPGGHHDAWGRAAEDLIHLGHGTDEEYRADAAAIAALVAAGYDPAAVSGYLERLERDVDQARPEVAAVHLAHPPPAWRRRRIGQRVEPVAAGPGRVNREVFRRMAGLSVLTRELRSAEVRGSSGPGRDRARVVGSALLAGLLLAAAGLILFRLLS